MKNIIAIIRPERVGETRSALEAIGMKGVTFLHVSGKGQQRGVIQTPGGSTGLLFREGSGRLQRQSDSTAGATAMESSGEEKELELGFLPKRMLVIVAQDNDAGAIVQTIINANQQGHHGDGKIFVCPMISALRVRTGEQGDDALS